MKEREELRVTLKLLDGWSCLALHALPGSRTWGSRFGHARIEGLVRHQVRMSELEFWLDVNNLTVFGARTLEETPTGVNAGRAGAARDRALGHCKAKNSPKRPTSFFKPNFLGRI